jgi:peptidoglycan/xylan/chitin deacetylase (PgdA/CDA1 family)
MNRIPVLIYHAIEAHNCPVKVKYKGDLVYILTSEKFEQQLNYLADNGYKTISLEDYVASNINIKNGLPDKALIITFDDGHITNYKVALPILQKYGFTATFFITLKNIDTPDGLTIEQLKDMENHGMSIQSHTMTHPFLSHISAKEIQWELQESKAELEEKLEKPVNYLAIPGGRYSHKVMEIAMATGYKAVCTSVIGYNTLSSDLYSIKRWAIRRGTKLSDFGSIIQIKYPYLVYNKTKYVLLGSMKKVLGNRLYETFREKVI